jgi:hypothetical protein
MLRRAFSQHSQLCWSRVHVGAAEVIPAARVWSVAVGWAGNGQGTDELQGQRALQVPSRC